MRFKNITIAFIVILVFAAAMFGLTTIKFSNKTAPIANQGILDLANWDLKKDGNISVNGQWKFYWQQFKNMKDFKSAPDSQSLIYGNVPSNWNNYELNGKKLPGLGYGTFRVTIKNAKENQLLALKIKTLSSAYKIYIDDTLITQAGETGLDKKSSTPGYKPEVVTFNAPSDEFDLIIWVSNFDHARGGVWLPLTLGTSENIHRVTSNNRELEAFLYGGIIIIMIYYMFIILFQKSYRAGIYIVLFSGMVILRMLTSGENMIARIIPDFPFSVLVFIQYLSYYWLIILYIGLLRQMYPKYTSKNIYISLITIAGLFTILTLALPSEIYSRIFTIYDYIILFLILYQFFILMRAIYYRVQESWFLFVAGLILVGTGVLDLLYERAIFIGKFKELMPYGFFILILVQAVVLGKHFSNLYSEKKYLSEKLISLDKLKDDFLANTTHELQTPLNGIINISQSILDSGEGVLTLKQRHNLMIVTSTAKRLSGLINDILDMARLKRNEIKIRIKSLNIAINIQAICDIFKHIISTKKVNLVCELPPDFPNVYADENRIMQILYNIIENAVKFTENGTITVSGRVEKDIVIITVEDTGIGIEKESQSKIFDFFEQADTSTDRVYEGTGLGLAISRQLAEKMNGSLVLEWSEPGKGSRFALIIPKSSEHAQEGNFAYIDNKIASDFGFSSNELPNVQKNSKSTVLVVDDSLSNLHSIAGILSELDCNIISALSGKEAIDIVEKNGSIDLVLLDVMMPKMSGHEVCRILRAKYSLLELPIIMITAMNTPSDVQTGFEGGANDYIIKPFEASEVRTRVKTQISLKKITELSVQNEMAFLFSQIKPHFLYNALNSISSLCLFDGEKASELVDQLAIYLQKVLREINSQSLIPFQSEIELTQAYTAIEKARFGERLKVEYDIDSIGHAMIPPLIIQPIVENAVRHGVMKKAEGGTVTLRVKKHGEGILIEVLDDGKGMPEDILKNLFIEKKDLKSVGILNIDKRLHKFFGKGLNVQSKPGRGTVVSFSIPFIDSDSFNKGNGNAD